jgi:hypothetical protein
MSNPRKSIFDLALSSIAGRKNWHLNTRIEEIEDLAARRRVSVEAKWTWIRLKGVFLRSELPGLLMENGEPMTMESIARELKRDYSAVLKREIDELINAGVLKKLGEFICDPATLSDYVEHKRKTEGINVEQTLDKLRKQHSAVADSSNPQVVDNERPKINGHKNQPSASSSTSNRTERTITGLTAEPTSAPHSAEAVPTINRQTAPSSLAWAANDSELDADLNKLSAEFPTLDVRKEFPVWLARCGKDGHEPTREWFVGFLRLAVQHAKKQSATPARNGDAAAPKKRKGAATDEEISVALRDMPAFEGRTEKERQVQIKQWWRKHISAPFNSDWIYGGDDTVAYTVDKFETDSDREDSIGIAGVNHIAEDENGIIRRKDSKWLVPGAYAAAKAEREAEAAQRKAENEKWHAEHAA